MGSVICLCIEAALLWPSGRVAVIGTGLTGLETAEILAMDGSKIIMVEMLPEIGPGLYAPILREMKVSLDKYAPKLYTGHQLIGITVDSVSLKCCVTEGIVQVEADSVVLALGVRPRQDLAETFRREFRNVVVVGDAEKGGRIYDAVKTGFCKAFAFNPA